MSSQKFRLHHFLQIGIFDWALLIKSQETSDHHLVAVGQKCRLSGRHNTYLRISESIQYIPSSFQDPLF